jgi:glycosyltransferase involved in cell wall biosynthesis
MTQRTLSRHNSQKKICMVTYSSYEADNRVRRYAEALVRRGDQVEVIALASGDVPLGPEEISDVTVYRIQRRDRNERGKWTYAWRLLRFLFASSVFLKRRHKHLRYDLIHIHNMPDFLAFAAWYPKWTGAKLILDIHDLVPEFFASKFKVDNNRGYISVLKVIEQVSASFVDHVIVSNHLWYEKLVVRSVSEEKCSVFLNHVDRAIFYRRPRTRSDGKFIVLFPGSLQWHQGLDIAIKAFARLKSKIPNAEFHIYSSGGAGGAQGELAGLANRLGLTGSVKFCSSLPLHQIAYVIANADLGVVPKRADSFGNEAYSTKIMEFMSQGVPVVASRTKVDRFYFDDATVRFFASGDDKSMAEAMVDVVENKELRDSLIVNGYKYVEQHSWDTRRDDYLKLVDTLTTGASADYTSTAEHLFNDNLMIRQERKQSA